MKINKVLTFSYDDGVESDKKLVALFNKYGVRCTFNLNSKLNEPGVDKGWDYHSNLNETDFHVNRIDMSKSDLRELYKGHEIASHGSEHKRPRDLKTTEELEKEYLEDKNKLSEYFDTEINGAIYPFGDYPQKVVDYLKSIGIKYSRTTEYTSGFDIDEDLLRFRPTCHHSNPELMNLADKFIESKSEKQQLFYVWGHAYEFDGNDCWNIMEDFLKKISGRNDILYLTNSEAFKYFGRI